MAICVYGVVLFCLGVCSISLVSAVVVDERLSSAVVVFPFIYPLRLLRASVRACVRACGAVPCRACARRAGCGSARLSSVRRSAADSVATPPPQHLPPPHTYSHTTRPKNQPPRSRPHDRTCRESRESIESNCASVSCINATSRAGLVRINAEQHLEKSTHLCVIVRGG